MRMMILALGIKVILTTRMKMENISRRRNRKQ